MTGQEFAAAVDANHANFQAQMNASYDRALKRIAPDPWWARVRSYVAIAVCLWGVWLSLTQ